MRGGHEDASQEKLNLVRALDPEGWVAQEMMGLDSPLPQEEVMVPLLEYVSTMAVVFFIRNSFNIIPVNNPNRCYSRNTNKVF